MPEHLEFKLNYLCNTQMEEDDLVAVELEKAMEILEFPSQNPVDPVLMDVKFHVSTEQHALITNAFAEMGIRENSVEKVLG